MTVRTVSERVRPRILPAKEVAGIWMVRATALYAILNKNTCNCSACSVVVGKPTGGVRALRSSPRRRRRRHVGAPPRPPSVRTTR